MDKELLKEILLIQTYSYNETLITKFIIDFISKINNVNYTIDKFDNILITKGSNKKKPCVVAHLDSVHDIIEDGVQINETDDILTLYIKDTDVQTGIGGDDKVGIFIALSMLLKYDNIKVAFFSKEEIGCIGSSSVNIEFFKDCNVILQADKKGNNEFVCKTINRYNSMTKLNNYYFRQKVKHIINQANYKFLFMGYMTDVVILKERGVNAPCANISCGYYNPHLFSEYVKISDVENCLNLMDAILKLYSI